MNITNHIKMQINQYQQEYAPFVRKHKIRVAQEKYRIDEFKVSQICQSIKSCKDAQGLREVLNYNNKTVPQYTHFILSGQLLEALKSLNTDNLHDLDTEHVGNSNNELARCNELAQMIREIKSWISKRMLLLFYYFQHLNIGLFLILLFSTFKSSNDEYTQIEKQKRVLHHIHSQIQYQNQNQNL